MTLASHARGPEFEPRCEYSHFFFSQKKHWTATKSKITGKILFFTPTPCSFVTLFVIDSRGFGHDTSLYYVFTTHRLSVEVSHTSFFKTGWEYALWPRFEAHLFFYADVVTVFEHSMRTKKKSKQQQQQKTCLKVWLVKKIVGFVMAPKHLAAPGDSARPGPRSWSASKPSAWPMDVAQTIQLISFVTM